MAYRVATNGDNLEFSNAPWSGYAFGGGYTIAIFLKRNTLGGRQGGIFLIDSGFAFPRVEFLAENPNTALLLTRGSSSTGTILGPGIASTTPWYLLVVTGTGTSSLRFHLHDGVSWAHSNGAPALTSVQVPTVAASDRLFLSPPATWGGEYLKADVVCCGFKKADTADLAVEALTPLAFQSWYSFGFDWLVGFDAATTRTNQGSGTGGGEIARTGTSLVADPPGWSWTLTPPTTYAWDFGDSGTSTATSPSHIYTSPGVYTVSLTATNAAGSNTRTRTAYVNAAGPFVPTISWFNVVPATAVSVPTYASARSYADVANRPAVTGTTRPFASSAALTGALNAAAPGDLVQYTGAGILDIPGNYTGFCGRRYAGYVNIDLGLPASANRVRFTGGGGAGLPAVAIYNSAFLRIYGGEITNPPPKTTGYDGLHIYGAQNPGNGSTNHIVWWNLLVHDTVDSGIKMLPNVVSGGGNAADNTIADCDIEAEVYRIGLDKSVDTSHAERGTGQHCCLLADTDPAGATYPSFLRNRVAIDGHDTGLTSSQGGGSVIELGFNDSASTISGCTLIMRGANTLFNAQQQTGGNGLNLWGSAAINAAVQYLQHSNATGSPVCNPNGTNRPGVVVTYGRHTSTNQNAFEGVVPWQIGPTYVNVA